MRVQFSMKFYQLKVLLSFCQELVLIRVETFHSADENLECDLLNLSN